MTDATLYSVPAEPGHWRAITLALAVHAALLAFLWFGVRWQNETPASIEAEVWSPQAREAAPQAEPEPEAAVKPAMKEPPQPAAIVAPAAKPDIALEQEKKRKEKEQKARAEEARREKLKADEKRIEKEKTEAAAKKKRDAENSKTADKKRQQDATDAQKLAKERTEEMRRIAGGVSGAGGSGDAAKSQGSRGDASYGQKIGAKIKSNINFIVPDNLSGNAPVEYVVDLLPDGSVAGIRKTKSSDVPGFDEAVRRAIEKSQPYPADKSGKVPSSFIGAHRPKDQ